MILSRFDIKHELSIVFWQWLRVFMINAVAVKEICKIE